MVAAAARPPLLPVLAGALLAASCASRAALEQARANTYRACLHAAEAALRLDEPVAANDWLDAAPVGNRGWEWHWLSARADAATRTLPAHPGAVVHGLRLDAGGTRLVSAGGDGAARVWDAATGAPLAELAGQGAAVYAAAFTPDGARIVTASADGSARLWDAGDFAPRGEVWASEQTVSCADVSPDGRRIAASSYRWVDPVRREVQGLVRLIDADTLEEVATLRGGVKPISRIRFSPDGGRLAASCWDAQVHVWELAGEAPVASLSLEHGELYSAVDDVAWSPDGARLAAASKSGEVAVFELASGERRLTLSGHVGAVGAVAFSPDGSLLASGGQDGTLRLWDAAGGAPRAVLLGHRGPIHGLAFTPDGAWLHSASADGSLRAWDLAAVLAPREVALENAYTLTLDAEGRRLAACSYDRIVRVWDTASLELLLELQPPTRLDPDAVHAGSLSVNVCAFQPGGALLASANNSGEAHLHDAGTGALHASLEPHDSAAAGLAFSDDGRRLAVGHADGTVRVFDPQGGALLWSGESASRRGTNLGGLDFDASGGRVVAPFGAGARILAAGDGRVLAELEAASGAIGDVAFAPDGRRVFGVGVADQLVCWDADSGVRLWSRHGDPRGAVRLECSADGTRVFTCGRDVAAFDARTGEPLLRWRPHRTGVYDLAFGAGGRLLASVGHDGRIRLDAVDGAGR